MLNPKVINTMESPKPEARESTKQDSDSLINMALYSHNQAHSVLEGLSHLPSWTNADTASFDCMHYLGDSALDHCTSKLDLKPSQHLLDIGSGYSATGRYLATKYHVKVTGIELQRENHELAQTINARNVDQRVVEDVRSVNADFLALRPETVGEGGAGFDHVISFLCIMHIPQALRQPLFLQAALFLKPTGKLYIEEFYLRAAPTEDEKAKLNDVIACPYVPTAAELIGDAEAAGFVDVDFEDVTDLWVEFVVARAKIYKSKKERNKDLEMFYDTVAEVFVGGNLGGVRLTAVKR